jgi:hypothetical protein
MNAKIASISFCLFSCIAGCSTTPGNAAYRSNQFEQAANMYKQGAEQGDGAAALQLGLMIATGKASAQIYGDKSKWYIRACDLGNAAGCHNSGNAYEYGEGGVSKDYGAAQKYYRMAAEKGYMQSQYNLGSMYSNQYFDDDVEGLKWLILAQKSASTCPKVPLCQWVSEDPPGHLKKLMGRMSSAKVTHANELANAWKPKP